MARPGRKRWSKVALGLFGAIALALATFALPIRSWRTGEIASADLPTSRSDAHVPERLWVDTDAACGHGRRSDPDDCLALLSLAQSGEVTITGVSTVFGNAEVAVTDRTTRTLASRLAAAGTPLPGVSRGAPAPVTAEAGTRTEATAALAEALASGRLTILALGPLTNIAATLRSDPALADNLDRIIAVMGQHPGHLFHPSEGRGTGLLFGHGPVFSDLNFRKDPAAVRFVLSTEVPVTLIPYEVARDVIVTPADMDRVAASGLAGAWIAEGAAGWMEFWQEEVGLGGFYPFDLVAARYILEPHLFRCGMAKARIEVGWAPDWLWMFDSAGLFVTPPERSAAARTVTYCPQMARAASIDVMIEAAQPKL